MIVPALPQFFAKYPDIELALSSNERRADLVEEGVDCAIWSGRSGRVEPRRETGRLPVLRDVRGAGLSSRATASPRIQTSSRSIAA